MNKVQEYHQRAAIAVCADIVEAAKDYDAAAMSRHWRTVQNIATAMEKQCVTWFPLDSSTPGEYSAPTSNGGGGVKVESSKPEPVIPPSGQAADIWASLG